MPTIRFTHALNRFFPGLQPTQAGGKTLHALLDEIEGQYPGIRSYLLDEQGQLRKHVNIFIDGTLIKDKVRLTDSFTGNSEIYIMQALSGG